MKVVFFPQGRRERPLHVEAEVVLEVRESGFSARVEGGGVRGESAGKSATRAINRAIQAVIYKYELRGDWTSHRVEDDHDTRPGMLPNPRRRKIPGPGDGGG